MRTSLLLGVFALAGCASAPIISNPADGPSQKASGHVTALAQLLDGKRKAVVIFIHGVGDNCPGYAVDGSTDSWLSPNGFPCNQRRCASDRQLHLVHRRHLRRLHGFGCAQQQAAVATQPRPTDRRRRVRLLGQRQGIIAVAPGMDSPLGWRVHSTPARVAVFALPEVGVNPNSNPVGVHTKPLTPTYAS